MRKKEIYKIIVKYLDNNTSKAEEELLTKWIENPENKNELEAFISMDYIVNKEFKKYSNKITSKEFLNNIGAKKVKKLRFIKYGAIAASIALLVSLTLFFNGDNSKGVDPVIVNNDIPTGTDKAILTLEDGSAVVLEKGQNYTENNLTSNGEHIVYKTLEASKQEIAYNYLTIPRGGQYAITLSDGTQVWLNSESKLKYPVNFIEGETREVELVYGEAYFDVSPSTDHNGSEFKVVSDEQMIKVLGTEFNVKAYRDDSKIYTTLVEGSIALSNTTEGTILTPNQQAVLTRETEKIEVITVDASKVALWRTGIFSFRGTSLKEVTKVLSRWYDVDFIVKDEALYDITFKGVLGKDQNIEEVLKTIITSRKLSNYEIKDKIIIIE
ncbi:FecR family protein [Flavivirga spongiicola]|uniref:DUF4974 domain-containing protein n=1 Tax=Flavivirga spongiicola TaxID=421621 RepID=A0ABU7XYH0_9FLAO|nr:FecR family protein [Flavivirga sp. MEBiC05379]MDO5980827.1 DUF4974 domain-containing protein [Flavivirga sp. MEBiC05379]